MGDTKFGTLHVLPTLVSTPNAHVSFFWHLQLLYIETRGLLGSSSEHEVEVSEEGRGVEEEDPMVDKQFAGAKASRRRSLNSLEAECDKLAHKCLAQGTNQQRDARIIVQRAC